MNASYRMAETQFVSADGHSFAYRELGPKRGIPLLLLQHVTGNLDDWDPAIIDGLAGRHHVVAFDNVGVGSSDGAAPNTIRAMAHDACAFIDAMGFTQVDVLGFSMGGFVAQVIAQVQPTRVRRMILAGTGPAGGRGISDMLGVFQSAVAQATRERRHPKQILFFSQSKLGQAAADAFLKRLEARTEKRDAATTMDAIQAQMTAIVAWGNDTRAAEALLSVTHPTFVANGDHDIMAPTENSFALFQTLPNAHLSIFPDAGHGGIFQYHDEFLKQALDFLQAE